MSMYPDLIKVLSGTKVPLYRIATIALAALVEREAAKNGVDPLKVMEILHDISKRSSGTIEHMGMVRDAARDLADEKGRQKIAELQAERDSLESTLSFANRCLERGIVALKEGVAKAAAGDLKGAEIAHQVAEDEFVRCDRAVSFAE